VTAAALALILAAAFVHASWNLLAKRASGHPTFTWLFAVLSAFLYAPVALAVLVFSESPVGLVEAGLVLGSGLLHTGYFVLLNLGYRAGDLSLVYPLARGTGPLLSTLAAIVLLGERPSALAISGGLLILAGIVTLAGDPRAWSGAGRGPAVGYALLTGAWIAAYTVWDKQAVGYFLLSPLLLDWGANVVRALLLTPLAIRHAHAVRQQWRLHRREAVAVALLAPLSYILVLSALRFTPVSYVAPAREVSILIGAAMGTRLLGEGQGRSRLAGAAAMMAGVVALAVG
jgi:drug/metabolite transporter (DMT)-like permease